MSCLGGTCNKRNTKMLRYGSVIGGISKKFMHFWNVLSQKTFPSNVLVVESVWSKDLSMGGTLDTCNVILKFLTITQSQLYDPSSDIQKYRGQWKIYWHVDERMHWKGKYYGSAQTIAYIRFSLNQWYAHHPFAFLLLEIWSGVQKISSVRSIHSPKVYKHLRTVCRENTTMSRGWKSTLAGCCWD